MFAAALDLEAGVGEAPEGRLEVGDDDGDVALRGHRRGSVGIRWIWVSLALQPGELGQRLGGLDLLEAGQPPELDRALDVLRR